MTIPILTYADYVAQAGLVEAPLMTPPAVSMDAKGIYING